MYEKTSSIIVILFNLMAEAFVKELPYPEKPVFLCYHSKAFPFGIIQANARGDMLPWLCSKSAGCIYNPLAGEDKFDLDIEDQWEI